MALPRLDGPVPSAARPQAGTWRRAPGLGPQLNSLSEGEGSSQTSPREDRSGKERHLELPASALQLAEAFTLPTGEGTLKRPQRGQEGD